MKLESIKNNPKFNSIANAGLSNVLGGKLLSTSKTQGGPQTDCWDDTTGKDVKTTTPSTGAYDAYDACPVAAAVEGPPFAP